MYVCNVSLDTPNIFESLFILTFEPEAETRYLAKFKICFVFLIEYLSIISLCIMSSKYCCKRYVFLSSDFSRTTSGKPPDSIYFSNEPFFAKLAYSLNDRGVITNDRFLPVSNVDNSLDSNEADEPEIMNFIGSLRSYLVLTHISHEGIFWTS